MNFIHYHHMTRHHTPYIYITLHCSRYTAMSHSTGIALSHSTGIALSHRTGIALSCGHSIQALHFTTSPPHMW